MSRFKVLFLEITSLGFISKQSYEPLAKYLKLVGVYSDHAICKCMENVIRSAYFTFRRNTSWTDPGLLNYV